ncbi:hypothetical protein [Synechococcus sp. CCAP 1479/9]|uniref:hypothetical protein n=1 Tax=Synechococcus sp. CCAP 1479/9 TaxID=1221593 RepID=UPI001C24B5C1|nr:hypothetical protein [Synechococcus sp. CCAP 1479/9]
MSIWDDIAKAAGHLAVGVVDAVQDLAMDPLSGSMKAELIILARKAQGKKAPPGNGPSRGALRSRGLVEPLGHALTRRGWNWYKLLEANGDVADFLRANDIDPWKDFHSSESRSAKGSSGNPPMKPSIARQQAKPSKAKPISQKSYFRWLYRCLLRMREFESCQGLLAGEHSVWTIIVEEELRALESLKPLLDMDDIHKSKGMCLVRDDLAAQARPVIRTLNFDFTSILEGMPGSPKIGVRSITSTSREITYYPIISESSAISFRHVCSVELSSRLQRILPSLR